MVQIWDKHLRWKLKELDKIILPKYREQSIKYKRDDAQYEKDYMKRVKEIIRNLTSLIKKAVANLNFHRGKGAKPKLKIEQRLRLILIHQLMGKSNRNMAYMLDLFSMMIGIDISYKTIERLYSDAEVEAALHNLLVLILKKKKVNEIDCCGDATGYSLIVSKHYSTEIQERKDKAKKQSRKRRMFVYKFALMDLSTRMYVCYGTSLISEAKAFHKAMEMLKELDISIKSIRLDRYYSNPCYVNLFPNSKVYIIPKKNSTMGKGIKWINTMRRFVLDTWNYLKEYFQRVNSENGFGVDKKLFGWKVSQKRHDRIDNALFCRCIWHNLFYLFS